VNWVTKNPEAFAAFVAFLAIIGGVLGSYIGAKVQANSGRAQAAAATDAARITVEYQHLAAFHADRRLVLATYLHRAEAVRMALGEAWRDEDHDAEEELDSLDSTQAELELISPLDVVGAALGVRAELSVIDDFVHEHGPVNHFWNALRGTADAPGFPSPEAEEAYEAVQKLYTAYVADHFFRDGAEVGMQRSSTGRLRRLHNLASNALLGLSNINAEDVQHVLDDAEIRSHLDRGLPQTSEGYRRARAALVEAGRKMLGSDLQNQGPVQQNNDAPRP
jgi:hypothetical protein